MTERQYKALQFPCRRLEWDEIEHCVTDMSLIYEIDGQSYLTLVIVDIFDEPTWHCTVSAFEKEDDDVLIPVEEWGDERREVAFHLCLQELKGVGDRGEDIMQIDDCTLHYRRPCTVEESERIKYTEIGH